MEQITNLNFLNVNNIIFDDKNRMFVVISNRINNKDQLSTLNLLEINEFFTSWTFTIPIACNSNYEFVSINDKEFTFKIYQSDISKKDVASKMLEIFNKK